MFKISYFLKNIGYLHLRILVNIILLFPFISSMFGSKLKPGGFAFVVKRDDTSNYIVIGRIISETNKIYKVKGTFIRPVGLIERIRAGRAQGKPSEALNNPDPNNCIFFIIDRLDTGNFDDIVDPRVDKITPINENRYFVLDGWIKESLPELFSNYFNATSEDERLEARSVLINRMNSLISQELKEHVYAVARSSQIL